MGLLFSPLSFVAGAAGWTLLEYTLHRFVGHSKKKPEPNSLAELIDPFKGDFGEEHKSHHRDPMYFAPAWRKAVAAGVVLGGMGTVGSLIAGPKRGLSFTAGFTSMYLAYEVVHRRIHTHAPRNAYSRWTRRHHLHHHFVSPRMNHGVTVPFWDMLFGTHETTESIRVPKKMAPEWMTDSDSEAIRDEFAADYHLT